MQHRDNLIVRFLRLHQLPKTVAVIAQLVIDQRPVKELDGHAEIRFTGPFTRADRLAFRLTKDLQEIMELSNVCVVRRPGESTELEQFGYVKKLVTENKVVFINRITPQISSTNVKAIIKDKNKVKRYLSPEVRDYIVRNGLYRTDEDK